MSERIDVKVLTLRDENGWKGHGSESRWDTEKVTGSVRAATLGSTGLSFTRQSVPTRRDALSGATLSSVWETRVKWFRELGSFSLKRCFQVQYLERTDP